MCKVFEVFRSEQFLDRCELEIDDFLHSNITGDKTLGNGSLNSRNQNVVITIASHQFTSNNC